MPSPLLEVRDLAKAFGGLRAADGIDLDIEAGGLLAIIGPNGCGKSTLFNLLCGIARADAGSIRLDGREIVDLEPHERARLGMARKMQVPGIFAGLSVAENLRVATSGPLGAWLDLARLQDVPYRPAGDLAHGQKQWLEIAMALATEPRLLLLDEPTAGMTAGETRETVALIRQLNRERGLATIVIEHDLAFVRALDTEVAVMLQGRIVGRGSYTEVARDPRVREAYLGKRA